MYICIYVYTYIFIYICRLGNYGQTAGGPTAMSGVWGLKHRTQDTENLTLGRSRSRHDGVSDSRVPRHDDVLWLIQLIFGPP